jgi:hypothetical protein
LQPTLTGDSGCLMIIGCGTRHVTSGLMVRLAHGSIRNDAQSRSRISAHAFVSAVRTPRRAAASFGHWKVADRAVHCLLLHLVLLINQRNHHPRVYLCALSLSLRTNHTLSPSIESTLRLCSEQASRIKKLRNRVGTYMLVGLFFRSMVRRHGCLRLGQGT